MAADGKLRSLSPRALRTRLALGDLVAELVPLSPAGRLAPVERSGGLAAVLRYLAYALPEREAVWWACRCVEHAGTGAPAAKSVTEAAQNWVRRPQDADRLALLHAAREAGASTPAGFVGRAAYASLPTDPASLRAGLSVAEAVRLAAGALPAAGQAAGLARFRASALDIAAGGAGWIEDARNEVVP